MSSNFYLLFFNVLCLTLVNVESIAEADKRMCPGTAFKLYEEMKCTPVLNTTSGSLCPASYNCGFDTPKSSIGCSMDPHYDDIMKMKCAPVYDVERPPQYHCPAEFRCYKPNDIVVIPQHPAMYPLTTEKCIFGDLKLNIRERLDRLEHFKSTQTCLDCMCDVPPFLTCDRLPASFCKDNNDITRID